MLSGCLLEADEAWLVAALKACAQQRDLYRGTQLHARVLKRGLVERSCFVTNTLISLYAKCGALAKAERVIEELCVRDVISWSALIAGYAQHGQGQTALFCLGRMQHDGFSPDAVTFSSLLKACGSIGAVETGELFHYEISKQGLLRKDLVLSNAVVDMYAKCGALAKARNVLEQLPARDVISWSALIDGYAQQGLGHEALACFEKMQSEALVPDTVTLISLLKACGSIGAADTGKQIHDLIIKEELLQNNLALGTALVDMYAKCSALSKAAQVLAELPIRNVVSWSALIAGYAQHGQGQNALNSFEQMKRDGYAPNEVTLMCALKGCGILGDLDKGEQIHKEIARLDMLRKAIELGTALVDMYVKCSALAKAHQVLENLCICNVVSWNALISGYVQQGQGEKALNCFESMQQMGITPDTVTLVLILKACGNVGAAERGEQIYNEICREGLLGSCTKLDTALVDMYAKCGALMKAQQVLMDLPSVNVVSWSALVAGFAQQGRCRDALSCLAQMERKGVAPNLVTSSSVLNACKNSGLVEEGEAFFMNMSAKYGIIPDFEHFTCMVDLFGRAGHFEKAVAMVKKMPLSHHPAVWSSLLGACRKWGDVKVGRWAFQHAVQADVSDVTAYIDMTNLYLAAGMPRDAGIIEVMRAQMKNHNL